MLLRFPEMIRGRLVSRVAPLRVGAGKRGDLGKGIPSTPPPGGVIEDRPRYRLRRRLQTTLPPYSAHRPGGDET